MILRRAIVVGFIILAAARAGWCETYVDASGKMKLHIGDAKSQGDLPRFSDPAKTIEVEAGKSFVITLESNRTTGYQWQFAAPFYRTILELVGVEYVKGPSNLAGAPGRENWTFNALHSTKEKVPIIFSYIRPWEKDVPPAKEITFFIIIAKGTSEQQLDSMQQELDRLRDESWTTHIGE